MPSTGEEKESVKSIRSTSPSCDSIERSVSVHDHPLECETPEVFVAPEVLPLSLRPIFSNNAASIATNGTNNPDYEVGWDDGNDPQNPKNWPLWYKGFTIFSISWSTWCIVVYSTSYTTGLAEMQHDFHISSEPVVTLGVTSYCEFRRSIVDTLVIVDRATSVWHCYRVYDTRTRFRNVRTSTSIYSEFAPFHPFDHSVRTRNLFTRSHHCTFLRGFSRVCHDRQQPWYR